MADMGVSELKATRKEVMLFVCIALFVACLLISSVTALKLWSVNLVGYEFIIPVGTSLFAITFPCTDLVTEIWGRRYALYVVLLGLGARVIALLFFTFAVWIPPVPFWESQEAYASILGGSTSIIIAGVIAYVVSQTLDVFIFDHFRKKDVGKNLLWKRNNLSTFTSQFIDSFLFVILAFGLSLEAGQIISAVLSQVILKWLIAVVDTPFIYVFRNITLGNRWYDFHG